MIVEPNRPAITRSANADLVAAVKSQVAIYYEEGRARVRRAHRIGQDLQKLRDSMGDDEYGPALEKIGISSQRASEFRAIATLTASEAQGCDSIRQAMALADQKAESRGGSIPRAGTADKPGAQSTPAKPAKSAFCARCQRTGPARDCPACKAIRPNGKPREAGVEPTTNGKHVKGGAPVWTTRELDKPAGELIAAVGRMLLASGLVKPPSRAGLAPTPAWTPEAEGIIAAIRRALDQAKAYRAQLLKTKEAS